MRFKLKTSAGEVELELDAERAPVTAENFASYARSGFYDGTIFHRVIDGFMVQGGGFEPGLTPKRPGTPIKNEADNGLSNVTGAVAMARTSDPDSASCQFFINVSDNHFLDHRTPTPDGYGYCVFGRVISGMDVIERIAKVETGRRGAHQDVPTEDVVVESVTEIE